MSADNWDECPRCKGAEVAAKAALDSAYGVVTREEWEELQERYSATQDIPECTFREDYEIYGAQEGEITVSYLGQCTRCGLKLEFTEVHPFFPAPEV